MRRWLSPFLLAAFATVCHGQGYALRFSADGQGVIVPDCPALHLKGDCTLEAWVKPEIGIRDFAFKFIISKNFNHTGFALLVIGRNDNQRIQFETSNDLPYFYQEPVARDTWWHIAAVLTGGKQTLYLNGVKVAEGKTLTKIEPNEWPLWIGSSLWSNFRGTIDDVRIWSVARTPEQIAFWKDRYLTGREPGIAAYWTFDEGRGSVLHDKTGHTPNGVIGSGFNTKLRGTALIESGHGKKSSLPQWVEGRHLIWRGLSLRARSSKKRP